MVRLWHSAGILESDKRETINCMFVFFFLFLFLFATFHGKIKISEQTK